MKWGWVGRLLAGSALLCLAPSLHAGGTPAGTSISNDASASYIDSASSPQAATAAPAALVVDELLDVAGVANDAGEVVVATPQAEAVLAFTLTNTGNAEEQYLLAVAVNLGADDFDPTNARIYRDEGNNAFNPGDQLVTSVTLQPDDSVLLFVAVDVPAGLMDEDLGRLELVATAATGSGPPGTRFAGQGAGGTDAVAGASGASIALPGALRVDTVPLPTPASLALYEHAPGAPGAQFLQIDGGFYDDTGAGGFAPLPAPATVHGAPLDTSGPVPVRSASVYHARAPIVIAIDDPNRSLDSSVRDLVDVTVTSSNGDSERLRLQETGPATGVFAGVIQTINGNAPVTPYDGRITVAPGSSLTVAYQDSLYPADTAQAAALVDPFGTVFDSRTGAPVDGATVTLLNADTGQPAQVYGDDGVSSYPATVVSGGGATDSGGATYSFGPGGFRFPFVAPGNYRLVVTPPAGYVTPSAVPAAAMPDDPAGNPYAVGAGSFGDVFVVDAGPALHIDIPADPIVTSLVLQKTVARPEASAGDFVQYRLVLRNTDPGNPAAAAAITDVLPPGLRYRPGSLRVGGAPVADPPIAADGRTLTIAAGTLAAAGTGGDAVEVSYVTLVVAGRDAGVAVNTAAASANGGTAVSNRAQASVRIREPFFSSGFTIVGRVAQGSCGGPGEAAPVGVPGARLLLDDGTYVVTDRDGLYHFEGVRPGTHVVQLDLDSLPPGYEAAPCIRNTRSAGRAYSQFVDVRGGGLWRADFFVRASAATPASVPDPRPTAGAETMRDYTLRAQFNRGSATLDAAGARDVQRLVDELRGRQIERIEIAGHTDSQPLSAANRRRFGDNRGLSLARARAVADALQRGLGLPADKLSAIGKGDSEPIADNATPDGRARNRRTEVRVIERVAAPAPAPAAAAPMAAPEAEVVANTDAAVGATDAWLAPAEGAVVGETVTVTIRHEPQQTVVLKYRPGEDAHPIRFEGARLADDGRFAVSTWHGVPVAAGRDVLEAVIADASGKPVRELARVVQRDSGRTAHVELVSAQSRLVADGLQRPRLALRLRDPQGRPAPAGTTGTFEVRPPHRAWAQVEAEQQRALAGLDRFRPLYRVEGDDGIAYVELAPTGQSGPAIVRIELATGAGAAEIEAWLEPPVRDWVIVGFAEGTAGYDTLKGNAQPWSDAEDGRYADGQVSLYAKGRVLGKWLLTLAYDSDKPEEALRRRSLLSTIDPDQFYTLYGDGSAQRHDAPSQDKLYLKLERGQFHALFGDYDTGLTRTELARYNRTLSGFKMESGAGPVTWSAFAAETPLAFARDELQGNGTSGLYRLSRANLVLNSEKIRIETRDRLHSARIVATRLLTRHLDYDIDYAAGTLFFREPITSRDARFNPVFIVAEYETLDGADDALNAGGRVGLRLLDGRLELGLSAVRDEDALGATKLGGADAAVRLGRATVLRVEGARSDQDAGPVPQEGDAWLAEVAHHGERVGAQLYARRQDAVFGVGQQNGAESGQQKVGASGQVRLTERWSVLGEAWRQENLVSEATRDAALGRLQFATEHGSASVGAQRVTDESALGDRFESEQGTFAAQRWLFDRRLELRAQADAALGGRHDSVDFPDRYVLGAAVAIARHARLVTAQEFSDGATFDSRTTRAGVELVPWEGARVTNTVHQTQVAEHGPRTFAQLGLTQALLVGERWGLDFTVDANRTLDGGASPLLLNPRHPIATGGAFGSGSITEDFAAFTAGLTYRADLWSWNGRAETRDGETADRTGFVTGYLRQARAGVAFAASARTFTLDQASGTRGRLAALDLSWAYRPLGSQWSVLDRLELRHDELRDGSGAAGGALFGWNGVVAAGDARSQRIVNNLALNRVSRAWTEHDRTGNLFNGLERSQWSLYYGAKYALDRYDGVDYRGYTDLLGFELRHDLRHWLDVGLQAGALHAWRAGTVEYSAGPRIGVTPVENGWLVLGWNFTGFRDADFDAARYSAQGPYLQIRFKFDQDTRLFGGSPAAASAARP